MQLAMAKDPEAAFFKRLEGLQPCEVSALKPGTHIFAVYGLKRFLVRPVLFDCVEPVFCCNLLCFVLQIYVMCYT